METHKSALRSFMTSCAKLVCKCPDPDFSDLFHSIKTVITCYSFSAFEFFLLKFYEFSIQQVLTSSSLD